MSAICKNKCGDRRGPGREGWDQGLADLALFWEKSQTPSDLELDPAGQGRLDPARWNS